MEISIANRQRTKKINTRLLKQIVAGLFAELEIVDAELGIHLVGAKAMARVNWQFLQHEGSTDVITFDHSNSLVGLTCRSAGAQGSRRSSAALPTPSIQLHGELFICVDDALMQARQFGTRWQAEVVRYVVHGVLHLLGYDDLKPALRRVMKREENRLMRRLAKRFALAQLAGAAKLGT